MGVGIYKCGATARLAPPLRPRLDVIIPEVWEKRAEALKERYPMSRAAKARSSVRVGHAPQASEFVRFAAHELAAGLSAMLGEAPRVEAVAGLDPRSLS